MADVAYQHRLYPKGIGGELRLGLDAHGHYRSSDLNVVGRDIRRGTADVTWLRSWFLRGGLRPCR